MRQVYDRLSDKQNNLAFLFFILFSYSSYSLALLSFCFAYIFYLSILFLLLFIYLFILRRRVESKIWIINVLGEVPFGAVTRYETLSL